MRRAARPAEGGARAGRLTVAVVVAVAVALLVLVPLVRLVVVVLQDRHGAGAALTDPAFRRDAAHSLLVAAGTVVLAVPAGTAAALVTWRPDLPGRRWLGLALCLPLLVPQLVLGYSWAQAYGPGGLTDQLLGLRLPGLFGAVGVVVVGSVAVTPVSWLVVSAALAVSADADLQWAGRASGASAVTVLRTVTLPLLRAPLVAAAAVCFAAGLDSFAVPATLGTPAGFGTMTTAIYADLVQAADPAAFTRAITLALVLALAAALVLLAARRGLAARPLAAGLGASGLPVAGASTRAGRLLAGATWAALVVTVGLPMLALVLGALAPAPGVAPVPSRWTLRHFSDALGGPTVPAAEHSLLLAAATAAILLLLGGLVAGLGRSGRGRLTAAMLMLTFALPGSVLAVGILVAYGRWVGDTFAIIVIAFLAKLWAFAERPIAASLAGLGIDEIRASRASGAGPWSAVRTVAVPRIAPALVAAAGLVFVAAVHEVTMSSLLYGPRTETLAVVVLNAQQLGDTGQTAAVAVLLTLVELAVGALALAGWLALRRRTAATPAAAPAAAMTVPRVSAGHGV